MEADTSAPQELCPPALKALLHHIVDYAGIFPPAQLPLHDAIHNFSRYRRGEHAWMLGRFVIPASHLLELDEFSNLYSEQPPFPLSVLGTKPHESGAFAEDLNQIQDLHERHNDRLRADVMEVPLPQDLLDASRSDLREFFEDRHKQLVMNGLSKLDIFFEIPVDEHSERRFPTIFNAMLDCNEEHHTPLRMELGAKFRLGGDDPNSTPRVRHLAKAISLAHGHDTRFKATAGLHHPLHHLDTETERSMHGFFNVFSAAAFAMHKQPDVNLLQEILEDGQSDHFRFDNSDLHWKDLSIPIETVIATRHRLALSFGSCSFDEPREDLQDMGLL